MPGRRLVADSCAVGRPHLIRFRRWSSGGTGRVHVGHYGAGCTRCRRNEPTPIRRQSPDSGASTANPPQVPQGPPKVTEERAPGHGPLKDTPVTRTAPPPLEAAAPDCRGGGNLHDPRHLAREAESRVPVTVTGKPGGAGRAFNRKTGICRYAVVFVPPGGRGRARHTAQRYRTGGTGIRGTGLRDLLVAKDKRPGRTVSRTRQEERWPGAPAKPGATSLA